MVQRLDRALVERGLVETRSRARDLILSGAVLIDAKPITKVAALVSETAIIALAATANPYVSRGALKLAAALGHFNLSPKGLVVLDIGSSTGGFTEVLLKRGAAKVYAIDVGRDQLHARLRANPRVITLESFDARKVTRATIPDPFNAVVADVSFISLTKALGPALALTEPLGWLIALIKPQFEAGRQAVGKGGIVRDPNDRARAVAEVRAWLAEQANWECLGVMPSPIHGSDGNEEFLLAARRHA
jgi:23S rRNA (cytidine1920-2'-O)/16S rRNA (cytidine1409-2'-O)-methyltransferase